MAASRFRQLNVWARSEADRQKPEPDFAYVWNENRGNKAGGIMKTMKNKKKSIKKKGKAAVVSIK